jgi:GT2 family glycosyltransferase
VVPDLSVIVLTFNTRSLTRACLQALHADAADTAYAIEVLVVDNGSTDDTAAMVRDEFPAARTIAIDTNLGFARGNNIGLAAARGRYLFLLNSDTEVQPGALAALIDFMDAHPDAGACGPMLLNGDGSLQPSGRELPSVGSVFLGMTKLYRLWGRDFYRQRGRDYRQPARVGEISGAALLVRREAYERVGGLDPNFFAYFEDTDWCKRIGEAGFAIYYTPSARVVHHWQGSSRRIPELVYRAGQDSLRYYFAKHHGPAARRLIQVLLAAKELLLIALRTFQGDREGRRFHQRMLANAWTGQTEMRTSGFERGGNGSAA